MNLKKIAVAVPMVFALGAALAAYPPNLVHYQGVLRDSSDTPLTGTYSMVFRLFSAAAGGDEILVDTHASVVVSGGLFSVDIGGGTITDGAGAGRYAYLPRVFADYRDVFLEVQVQGEVLAPRTRIESSAFALNARYVNGVEIATPDPFDLYVDAVAGDDDNSGLSAAAAKRTIQAAIDRIPVVFQGDVTVHIAPGTYVEEVVLAGRLTQDGSQIKLLGSPGSPSSVRIDGAGSIARVVQLSSVRNVTLEGLEIRGATDYGVFLLSSPGVTLRSCVVTANAGGILATRSSLTLEATTIQGQSGTGLGCISASLCRLGTGTDIRSNQHGVWADRAASVQFTGSAIVTANALSGLTGYNSGVVDFADRSDVEVTGNGQNLEARAHGIVRSYGYANVGSPQCVEQDYGLCRPWG